MPKTTCGQPVPRATAQDRQGRPYILPNALAMLEDVDRRGGSSQRPAGAAWGQGVLIRLGTIVRKAVTGGTLAIRLLATGILLVMGLPLLSMLLYIWGYPATPVPLLLVVLVDGLQLLIVAYAVVVGAQLVAYAAVTAQRMRGAAPGRGRAAWGERPFSSESRAAYASSHDGWTNLREWSVRLADMIWLQEQRGRSEFGPAALAYVRDAVTVELEHRRRAAALERRAAELEAWTGQDSVVASERM